MQYLQRMVLGAALVLALGVLSWAPARADALADVGRSIAEKWRQAVVPLQVTTKTHITGGGGEEATNEEKSETVGTVIDPTGLIVTSLTSMSFSPEYDMGGAGGEDMQVTSEISGVTIVLEGGQEIPASVVLRDKDHDLAFIRPLKTLTKPLTAVDLATASKPGLLDETIMLDRLGVAGNRAIAAYPGRIIAIVEKPSTFYVPISVGNNLGVPIFSLDGKLIGIRVVQLAAQGTGKYGPDMLDIIRPAADIAEAAKQAK